MFNISYRDVEGSTRDVDLLAIAADGELRRAEPLPQALLYARAAVAADFGLDENWLNAGQRICSNGDCLRPS